MNEKQTINALGTCSYTNGNHYHYDDSRILKKEDIKWKQLKKVLMEEISDENLAVLVSECKRLEWVI